MAIVGIAIHPVVFFTVNVITHWKMSKFSAELYKSCDKAPRRKIIQETVDKFAKRFVWRNDGTDSLVDVGCGTGDFTNEFFIPLMPSNYKRFVGYDISLGMVKHANETYGSERIKFEVVDIVSDLTQKIDKMEKFDHAVSTFALMWVSNLRKAISNISKVLTENGDLIMVTAPRISLFDFIYEQLGTQKWRSVLPNFKPHWDSSYNRDIYFKEFKSHLTESGFKEIDIGIKTRAFNFASREELKRAFFSVGLFNDVFSEDQMEEMFDDFVKFNVKLNTKNPLDDMVDGSLCMQFEILSGYAGKQKKK